MTNNDLINMKPCYVCNFDEWLCNPISYKLDYSQIEILHDAIECATGNNSTLKDLYILGQLYESWRNEVINTINISHNKCPHRCTSCGHVVEHMEENIEVEADVEFSYILQYYLSVSDRQFHVLETLRKAKSEIQSLGDMIGMKSIKDEMTRFLKSLCSRKIDEGVTMQDMMHCVIYAPPGHGKTAVAKMIGKLMVASGILKKDVFVEGSRSNMIADVCGGTAKAVKKIWTEAKGGVIFLDELYSFGNKKNNDVFTKECMDTINICMSENPDTLVIGAGYYDKIQESFFSYNPGLKRRFVYEFFIEQYTADELCQIFCNQARGKGWYVTDDAILITDVEPYMKTLFEDAGGSMANLLTRCLTSNNSDFLSEGRQEKLLTREIVLIGLEAHRKHYEQTHKRIEQEPLPYGFYI
jgi:hypothetical protein